MLWGNWGRMRREGGNGNCSRSRQLAEREKRFFEKAPQKNFPCKKSQSSSLCTSAQLAEQTRIRVSEFPAFSQAGNLAKRVQRAATHFSSMPAKCPCNHRGGVGKRSFHNLPPHLHTHNLNVCAWICDGIQSVPFPACCYTFPSPMAESLLHQLFSSSGSSSRHSLPQIPPQIRPDPISLSVCARAAAASADLIRMHHPSSSSLLLYALHYPPHAKLRIFRGLRKPCQDFCTVGNYWPLSSAGLCC